MQVLDRIQNKIGAYTGVTQCPATGQTQYTLTADMDAGEIHDASNWLDLVIEVRRDGKWTEAARWSLANNAPHGWQGGPGKNAPSLTYVFPVLSLDRSVQAPAAVRGVLINGTKGAGSPAIVGLKGVLS